jgi:chemotaxis signal transduction protein
VMRIPKSKLEVPPITMGDINRDYISYFVHRENEFIAVLNLEKIVGVEK